MLKKKEELTVTTEANSFGKTKMYLSHLKDFPGINQKLRMYAQVDLLPGESVEYHMHIDECEIYYILSGKGLYNDNGQTVEVLPGAVTYTPSGEGHGIKNIGEETLSFMALILLD